VDPGAITSLVAELSKKDGAVRERARQQLVAIGAPAVTYLVEALVNRNELLRWEAAKALGEIGNLAAAPALVAALEDEVFDVRWLAAEGLVALRGEGLVPLLSALVERPDSLWLREGAHHVLHDVSRGRLEEVLRPVVAALDDVEPSVEVPFAAKTVLKGLVEVGGGSGWEL
jgi:HEAT repeat protein